MQEIYLVVCTKICDKLKRRFTDLVKAEDFAFKQNELGYNVLVLRLDKDLLKWECVLVLYPPECC